jgi:ribonuclease-3
MNLQIPKQEWINFMNNIVERYSVTKLNRFILNEDNRYITSNFINDIFKMYGITYKVRDLKLYQVAMTHPSYVKADWSDIKNFKKIFMGINVLSDEILNPINEEKISMTIPIQEASYERLEFLGDSILRLILTDYGFVRYPEKQEGDLTKLRSQIENGTSLAEISKILALNKYVIISRNYEYINARNKNQKILCDVFEAFIGAMYLDACEIKYDEIGKIPNIILLDRGYGYKICYEFITTLIEKELDLSYLLENDTNYKDKLLQYFHEKSWGDPSYGLMDTIVEDVKLGKRKFKMYVRDKDKNIIGIGVGSSKQKGEKLAAKKALEFLKVISPDDEDIIINDDELSIINIDEETKKNIRNNKNNIKKNSNKLEKIDENKEDEKWYSISSKNSKNSKSKY